METYHLIFSRFEPTMSVDLPLVSLYPLFSSFSLSHTTLKYVTKSKTDWVADMIDGEKYRQEHHEEYEEKWMKKNKAAVLSRIDVDGAVGYPSQMMGESDREAMAEHRRDEKMAFTKPEKYCADRCVATGNCDILEDFYELGPEDVIAFCKECVLNNNDETIEDGAGCVIPEAFYDKEPPLFRP
jgi:hypothetical protein